MISDTKSRLIVKASQFDVSKITMKGRVDNGAVQICYDRRNLYLNTEEALECPYGVQTDTMILTLTPNMKSVFEKLDVIAEKIGKMKESELGETTYSSLFTNNSCSIDIHTDKVSIFNDSGVKIVDPVELSNKFSAVCLFWISGLQAKNGVLFWNIEPVQMRLKESSCLPQGCLIPDDDEESSSSYEYEVVG